MIVLEGAGAYLAGWFVAFGVAVTLGCALLRWFRSLLLGAMDV